MNAGGRGGSQHRSSTCSPAVLLHRTGPTGPSALRLAVPGIAPSACPSRLCPRPALRSAPAVERAGSRTLARLRRTSKSRYCILVDSSELPAAPRPRRNCGSFSRRPARGAGGAGRAAPMTRRVRRSAGPSRGTPRSLQQVPARAAERARAPPEGLAITGDTMSTSSGGRVVKT